MEVESLKNYKEYIIGSASTLIIIGIILLVWMNVAGGNEQLNQSERDFSETITVFQTYLDGEATDRQIEMRFNNTNNSLNQVDPEALSEDEQERYQELREKLILMDNAAEVEKTSQRIIEHYNRANVFLDVGRYADVEPELESSLELIENLENNINQIQNVSNDLDPESVVLQNYIAQTSEITDEYNASLRSLNSLDEGGSHLGRADRNYDAEEYGNAASEFSNAEFIFGVANDYALEMEQYDGQMFELAVRTECISRGLQQISDRMHDVAHSFDSDELEMVEVHLERVNAVQICY